MRHTLVLLTQTMCFRARRRLKQNCGQDQFSAYETGFPSIRLVLYNTGCVLIIGVASLSLTTGLRRTWVCGWLVHGIQPTKIGYALGAIRPSSPTCIFYKLLLAIAVEAGGHATESTTLATADGLARRVDRNEESTDILEHAVTAPILTFRPRLNSGVKPHYNLIRADTEHRALAR